MIYDCLWSHSDSLGHALSMQNDANHNHEDIIVLILLYVCMRK